MDGFAPAGRNISANILKALEELKPLLTDDQIDLLRQQAEIADRHHGNPPPPRPKNNHPLRYLQSSAPLYSALGSHVITAWFEDYAKPLLLRAHQAALLSYLNDEPDTKIANFTHQLTRNELGSILELATSNPATLSAEAIQSSTTILKSLTTSSTPNLAPRIREFTAILKVLGLAVGATPQKRPRAKPSRPGISPILETIGTARRAIPNPGEEQEEEHDSPPTARWRVPQNPDKSPEDETDNLEPTLSSDELADVDHHEGHLRTFGLSGHRLRMTRLFAERSQEAATPVECDLAFQGLLELQPTSPASHGARLAWILTAISARHYDKIANAIAFGEREAENGQIVAIKRNGCEIIFALRHMIASVLPSMPIRLTEHEVLDTFHLRITLPDLENLDTAWNYLLNCNTGEKIDELLEQKKAIQKHIRKNYAHRFTETRIRGSLAQRVFAQNFDFPLTQLLFNESLDVSAAALHYIVWHEHELQEKFTRALTSLYGEHLPPQPKELPSQRLTGASKAALPLKALRPIARHYRTNVRHLQSLKKRSNWKERHNLQVENLANLFVAGAAHRNTYDLGLLKITDLSLSAGIVLFRDKPADSSVYRRIAALPSILIRELQSYLAHLQELLDYKTRSLTDSVRQASKAALDGTGPLLYSVIDNQVSAIQPREIFTQRLDPKITPNIFRHLQSTHLRRQGASALLLEAHLGHHFSNPIFGDSGLVSPIEMGDHLRPHLDRFLEELGYPRPSTESTYQPTRQFTAQDLHKLKEEEQQNDRKTLRRQLKDSLAALPCSGKIDEKINSAIQSKLPDYKPGKPPKGINVDRASAIAIRDQLVSQMGNDLTAIYRACRRLRRSLKRLRIEARWQVELPPAIAWDVRPPLEITRANMVATDQQAVLQRRLLAYCQQTQNIDLHAAAKAALVLWGDCPTFQQAQHWLDLAKNTPLRPGEDILIIDINRDQGSRTITGIALVFVAAWRRSGSPANTTTTVSHILGSDISVADVETTVRYANYITNPGVVAEILNDQLPHKELERERLRTFLDNGVGNKGEITGSDADISTESIITKQNYRQDKIANEFKQLKKLIKAPPRQSETQSGKDKQIRPTIRALKAWRSNIELPTNILLMKDWAIRLLGPTANIASGGELDEDTVSGYLNDVWGPLNRAFPTGDLIGADIDEATELLENALSDNWPTKKAEEINRLNRFFREMSTHHDIPCIRLTQDDERSPVPIQASVITEQESTLIRSILQAWWQGRDIEAPLVIPVKQVAKATEIYEQSGARRNEMLDLLSKDIVSSRDLNWLIIRPNFYRSLKTSASHRYLQCNAELTTAVGTPAEHYFDNLKSSNSRTIAMHAFSVACRFATGKDDARLHHFRHTVATRVIAEGLQIRDPVQRIGFLTKAGAELGHGTLRTTLRYYAHMTHYTIAMTKRGEENVLDNKVLKALFNEQPEHLRQRKSRARNGRGNLAAQYCKPFNQEKHAQTKKLPTPPPLPALLRKDSQPMMLSTTALWLLRFARGATAYDACLGLEISLTKLNQLLDSLYQLQKQVRWHAVDEEVILRESDASNVNHPIHHTARRDHKRFPPNWVDQQIVVA